LLQFFDLKLRALCIQSPEKVFTAGQFESVYESQDLGLSWEFIPNITGAGVWFRDITFHDKQNGYIVGDAGRAYKTPNFGYGWFLMNTGSIENLYGVSAPSEDTAYICGLNGTIIKTTNSGISWESVYSGQDNFISICFLSNHEGYVSSNAGVILHTLDGGNNWEQEEPFTTEALEELCYFPGINRMFVCGHGGIIRYKDLSTGLEENYVNTRLSAIVKILPNPATDVILIRISGLEYQANNLAIYNSESKKIASFENVGNGEIEVNISSFQPGTYFYKLTGDKTIIGSGKFVKN
jgi:hypothetical protein